MNPTTQTGQALLEGWNEQYVPLLPLRDSILAIEAEAVADFIKDRLPSLLAEALTAYWVEAPGFDENHNSALAAALVAYIEKEARNG